MPRSRIYVWAAPCPTCRAGKDKPCQDQRTGLRRSLYGRRTHKARAEAVRAMGNPRVIPTRHTLARPSAATITWQQTANAINVATAQYVTAMNTFTTAVTNTANIITTTTAGWTVTRDEMWNSWINLQQTTTGATVRYEYTDEQVYAWNRWNEIHYERVLAPQEAIRVMQEEVDRQQRAREEANRFRLAQLQAAQERATEAHDRAMELFLSLLTEEQRIQWIESEAVHVRGSAGGLYEIRGGGGVHGNISLLDEHGCRLANLCVSSEMYDREHGVLPTPDGWVGQLLAIRHDEPHLRQMANMSMRRRCQYQAAA